MDKIIYKSKYSEVCDKVGYPKPKIQEEENYCQLVEFEHPKFAKNILNKMINNGQNRTN